MTRSHSWAVENIIFQSGPRRSKNYDGLTTLTVVGVDALRGHELADERGLADALGAHDGDAVRDDGGQVLGLGGDGGRSGFYGRRRRHQTVGARTASSERVASVHHTC